MINPCKDIFLLSRNPEEIDEVLENIIRVGWGSPDFIESLLVDLIEEEERWFQKRADWCNGNTEVS